MKANCYYDGMPKTKVCTKCKKRKNLHLFGTRTRRGTTRPTSWCKACTNDCVKQLRHSDEALRARNREGVRLRKQAIREEVYALKRGPCIDCHGTFNPWQLHFDHVKGVKLGSVSDFVQKGNRTKLHEEISKCELVCANCHAERTYRRIQVPLV